MLVDPIQTPVTSTGHRVLRGCGYVSGLFSIANPGSRRTSTISSSQAIPPGFQSRPAGFRLALTMYPPTSHDEGLSSRHAP
jgi:hypothetical protein